MSSPVADSSELCVSSVIAFEFTLCGSLFLYCSVVGDGVFFFFLCLFVDFLLCFGISSGDGVMLLLCFFFGVVEGVLWYSISESESDG